MKEWANNIFSILQGEMVCREIPKHAFVWKPGQPGRELYYVRKGLLRSYYHYGENEISTGFIKENDWLLSINSFYEQMPIPEYIQAIEDTELYAMDYQRLRCLLTEVSILADFPRVLTLHHCSEWRRQLMALRGQSAVSRYRWLLAEHPELVLRVPCKYLASWLDMAEVTWSKIGGTCKQKLAAGNI